VHEGHEWSSTHRGHPFAGGGLGGPWKPPEAAAREARRAMRDRGPEAGCPGQGAGSAFVASAVFFVFFVEAFEVFDQAEAR
jgi:hypothetical protein